MSRDISESIRVVGESVVVAVLILDVETGLIRGLSVAADIPGALSQSVERALHEPAGPLPPRYPEQVLAAAGLGECVADEFLRLPGLDLLPAIDEIVPGEAAEEIFDQFVEAFSWRVPGWQARPTRQRVVGRLPSGVGLGAPRSATDVQQALRAGRPPVARILGRSEPFDGLVPVGVGSAIGLCSR